jgi:hypothetical protein
MKVWSVLIEEWTCQESSDEVDKFDMPQSNLLVQDKWWEKIIGNKRWISVISVIGDWS